MLVLKSDNQWVVKESYAGPIMHVNGKCYFASREEAELAVRLIGRQVFVPSEVR